LVLVCRARSSGELGGSEIASVTRPPLAKKAGQACTAKKKPGKKKENSLLLRVGQGHEGIAPAKIIVQ